MMRGYSKIAKRDLCLSKYYNKRGCVITGLFLLIAASLNYCMVYADILYLKNGVEVKGEIIEETDKAVRIRVETGEGPASMGFPHDSIESILYQRTHEEMLKIYKEKVEKIDPDTAEAHYKLALFCKQHELLDEAEKELKQTLQLIPQVGEAVQERLKGGTGLPLQFSHLLLEVANKKCEEKFYSQAKVAYEELLKLGKDSNEAKEKLKEIKALWQRGKKNKLAADQYLTESYHNESEKKTKRDKAFELYREAVLLYPEISQEIGPDDAMLHFKLGQYFAEAGLDEFMEKEFETVLNLNPKHRTLIEKYLSVSYEKRAQAEYEQGKRAYQKGEYNLAMEKSQNVIDKFDKSGIVKEAKKLIIASKEKLEQIEKKEAEERARRHEEENLRQQQEAEALYRKAYDLDRYGKGDQAIKEYKKIVKYYPNYICMGDVYKGISLCMWNTEEYERLEKKTGIHHKTLNSVENTHTGFISFHKVQIKYLKKALASYKKRDARSHRSERLISTDLDYAIRACEQGITRIEDKIPSHEYEIEAARNRSWY